MEKDSIAIYNIADMAIMITKKIGKIMYRQLHIDDEYIGTEYIHDKFKISFYDQNPNDRQLYIALDDVLVLTSLSGNKYRNAHFLDDRWPRLVTAIYSQIPNILEQENKIKQTKKDRLKSYEILFKYYVECDNSKLCESLNSLLASYGIIIKKDEVHIKSKKDYINNYDYVNNTYYSIIYNGSVVARFAANIYEVFSDMQHYLKIYKPGEWENYFRNAIFDTMICDFSLKKQQVENNKKLELKRVHIEKQNKL